MSNLMKWSGSKSSQAKSIIEYIPDNIDTYYECFAGGGSVFLKLLEDKSNIKNYVISDINILNVLTVSIEYNCIQSNPHIIISAYTRHYNEFNSGDINHRKEYFSKVKKEFNITKSSEDFYWIMRTTTNGLPRYNQKGEFNNSCHFTRPGMNPVDVEKLILEYNGIFNSVNIKFIHTSYHTIFDMVGANDILYLDPPYENTKGMYFGNFNNVEFIENVNALNAKWIISYDGKVNSTEVKHVSPNYKRMEYLNSGNSSFRRIIGNSKDSIVQESLYLNF